MSCILSRWRVWETSHVKAHRCHQLENLNPKAHNSGARRLPMLGHHKKSGQLRIPSDPKIQCIGVLGGAKSAADAAPLRLCQGRKRGALDHLRGDSGPGVLFTSSAVDPWPPVSIASFHFGNPTMSSQLLQGTRVGLWLLNKFGIVAISSSGTWQITIYQKGCITDLQLWSRRLRKHCCVSSSHLLTPDNFHPSVF